MIDVGIVGAGPVGLTLACLLRSQGRRVQIHEQETSKPKISKAFAIHARTLELLRRIGVDEAVLQEGRAIRRMSLYSEKQRLGTIDFRHLKSEFPFFISIPQYRLEAILTERFAALGGEILAGQRFIELEQDKMASDSVTVVTEDGVGRHEQAYRYLVGCDGSHSAVRKHLGIAFKGDTYDSEFLVVDARIAWKGNRYEAHTFLSSRGYLMIMPFAGLKHRIVTDIPSGHFKAPPTLEEVHELLQSKGFDDIRLSEPDWISNTRYHKRLADRFRAGNVFLAGDACHIHSPVGGQGLNTGIQDAFNLGWKLALALSGRASERLLDSYDRERRPIARTVLANTDAMTRRFADKNPVKVTLRKLLLPILFSLPKLQKKLVENASGVAIHYGDYLDATPVVKAKALSGRRLPDVMVRVGDVRQRLHRLLPPHGFALLAIHRVAAAQEEITVLEQLCGHRPSDLRLIALSALGAEPIGLLHLEADPLQALAPMGKSLILVRPDGYIAYAADDWRPHGIETVLANYFAPLDPSGRQAPADLASPSLRETRNELVL